MAYIAIAAVLLVVCFLKANWWVNNKSTPDGEVPFGRNEIFTYGEDSEETINKMTCLAREIFTRGELLKSEDGFSIQVTTKNNRVTNVVIRSKKTKVTYNEKDGMVVTKTANSRTEIVVFMALISWCIILLIPMFIFLVVIFFSTLYMLFTT